MEQYTTASRQAADSIIRSYSTSFGVASRLFGRPIRGYIGDIYALVRIADEIVDTYGGPDAADLLNDLEHEVYRAIARGYSTNIVVQAFAATARRFDIDRTIIEPFFASMRMDLEPPSRYDQARYEHYIYGSAEVVGLMCLKVFVDDEQVYSQLTPGARALGAAFQKVNFVRDIADDFNRLQRFYFPQGSFDTFDDQMRDDILADITNDFTVAKQSCRKLPRSSQYAVGLALRYFELLAVKLGATPAITINTSRVRLSASRKLRLYMAMACRRLLGMRPV